MLIVKQGCVLPTNETPKISLEKNLNWPKFLVDRYIWNRKLFLDYRTYDLPGKDLKNGSQPLWCRILRMLIGWYWFVMGWCNTVYQRRNPWLSMKTLGFLCFRNPASEQPEQFDLPNPHTDLLLVLSASWGGGPSFPPGQRPYHRPNRLCQLRPHSLSPQRQLHPDAFTQTLW